MKKLYIFIVLLLLVLTLTLQAFAGTYTRDYTAGRRIIVSPYFYQYSPILFAPFFSLYVSFGVPYYTYTPTPFLPSDTPSRYYYYDGVYWAEP